MRLLKGQNTNLRNIYGKGIKYDINGQVILDSTNSLLIPVGGTADRPSTAINGQIRYNSDLEKFEVYEGNTWYGMANTAPAGVGSNVAIVQQNLGNGDATSVVFGPLDSQDTTYPAPQAAQNILVFVENVFQIATTNYLLEQNPTNTYEGAEVTATNIVAATEYYIISVDDGQGGAATDFTTIGSADNNPGTVFTATGIGSGTGNVRETGYYLRFTSAPDLNKPITVIHNFDK